MSWVMDITLPAAWLKGFNWTGFWRLSFLSESMVAWILSAGIVTSTLVAVAEVHAPVRATGFPPSLLRHARESLPLLPRAGLWTVP